MTDKKDIFDKLFALPFFRLFNPLFQKYREVWLYLFFGGCTFLINTVLFAVLTLVLQWNEHTANLTAWIISVTFAFNVDRAWVFRSGGGGAKRYFKQMASFFGARVATLVVEEVLLFIFITQLALPKVPVKIGAQVIVTILNYLFSKLLIFRKK